MQKRFLGLTWFPRGPRLDSDSSAGFRRIFADKEYLGRLWDSPRYACRVVDRGLCLVIVLEATLVFWRFRDSAVEVLDPSCDPLDWHDMITAEREKCSGCAGSD